MSRPRTRKMRPERAPTNAGQRPKQRDVGEVQQGTVGWEDGQDHFDLESEGVPLLKVTLFQGHNPDTQGPNPNPTRAMGRQVLARFDGRSSDIPNDGELVILMRPAGMAEAPGAFYVAGRPMPDPKWIPNRKSGEKIIQGPGDSFVRMKTDGTIHVFTRETPGETGKTVCFQVRPDGFVFEHPHMRITMGPNGYHAAHSSGARIDFGAIGGLPAPFDALASWLKLSAAVVKIEASATEIGPAGGVPDNLTKVTPLLALLAAIEAEIAVAVAYTTAVASAAGVTALVAAPLAATVAAAGATAGLLTAAPVAAATQALTGA